MNLCATSSRDAAAGVVKHHALSPLQSGMLYQAVLDPHAGYDTEQLVVDVTEPLDAAHLAAGFAAVLARHDVLRSSFSWEGLAEPEQRVHAAGVAVDVDVVDARGWSAPDFTAFLEADRRRGFDLTRPPLMRATLFTVDARRCTLVWTFHHLLLDGRSFAPLLFEIFEAAAAARDGRAPALPPPPPPFSAFADASSSSSSSSSSEGAAFFRALLAGKAAPTPLPLAAPLRAERRPRAGEVSASLSAEVTQELRALAASTSMGTVVQALWGVLLARFTHDHDVVFGAVRAGRRGTSLGRSADHMLGMFINTLPVRARIDEERTFAELLADLRAQSLAARPYERTSLVDVAAAADLPKGAPLFETLVMFDNAALQERLHALDPAWRTRTVRLVEQPSPPLTLIAHDGASLSLKLVFDARRYSEDVARRLLTYLVTLAARCTRPGEKLASLHGIPDEELTRTLRAWNDTARAFPADIPIHRRFEEQVDARGDDVACVFEGDTLTFRALEERANRIAHVIKRRGVGPGEYVAFALERGFDLVAAMIGVAKSGAAYLPIDLAYPEERARFMLADARVRLVITSSEAAAARAQCFADVEVLTVDAEEVRTAPSSRPACPAQASDVCYVIYTSGSTGTPKGVVLTHRAVVNTLEWVTRTFRVSPRDRLLFVTSPSFDLSVYDVFGALGAGASIEIASAELLSQPERLVEKLVQPGITIWDSAPAALARLAPLLPKRPAPHATLRLVMLSGDWIPVRLPDELRAVFPCEVKALGGATEAAIWSNWYDVGAVDERWTSIPYGKPIQNARYYILDERLRPVPTGVAGDLYIGGACLAAGYLARDALTREKFLADPFVPGERIYKTGDLARFWDDGTMEFLGRADFQVKIRGFRVELGEVEVALRRHEGVKDAICVAKADVSGQKSIVAYVVPAGDGAADVDTVALRASLATSLPEFMVPSAIVTLAKLPVTANGKLDRAALPDPSVTQKKALAPPENDAQRALVDVWRELLRRPVGVHDHFFDDLGGHSLMAVMLVARIKERLGKDVPLSLILKKPTVAQLAEVLAPPPAPAAAVHEYDGKFRGSSYVQLMNAEVNTPEPLPVFMASGVGGQVFIFRDIARRLSGRTPIYGIRAVGADGECAPKESIAGVARVYVDEIERDYENVRMVIGGYSMGATVAFELAAQLLERKFDVAGIVLVDGYAPGYPRRQPPLRRAMSEVALWARSDWAKRKELARERVRRAAQRAGRCVGRPLFVGEELGYRPDDPVFLALPEEMKRKLGLLWLKMETARAAWRAPRVLPLPMLLFRPTVGFFGTEEDPANGWRDLISGPIDVVSVPGDHHSLTSASSMKRIGDELEPWLEALRRSSARPGASTPRWAAHEHRMSAAAPAAPATPSAPTAAAVAAVGQDGAIALALSPPDAQR